MLAWSSFFGAGKCAKISVARLEKAGLLLGVSKTRKSKAVLTAGYGPAEAGDRSHSPRPAASKDQLIQLVSTYGSRNELSIIVLQGWTFLPRAPSGCLPL